jgi:hypothetical protein
MFFLLFHVRLKRRDPGSVSSISHQVTTQGFVDLGKLQAFLKEAHRGALALAGGVWVQRSKFNDWPDVENIIQWNKLDIFLRQKMDD